MKSRYVLVLLAMTAFVSVGSFVFAQGRGIGSFGDNMVAMMGNGCMMNVSSGSPDIKSTYKRKTYHFCAEGCKKEFESDPEIFLSPKPPKKKGWWGRYLCRLEKATGGKAMKCH